MDVRLPDGTIIQNVPDGTTRAQLVERMQRNGMSVPGEWLSAPAAAPAPVPSAVESTGRAINDIPRQVGLTARYGLEGLGNAAQIVTEPVRRLITDPLIGRQSRPLGEEATRFADWLGLPAPRDATERVVGDAARLVAGAGGTGALARAGGAALAPLTANMPQQLGSAAGAGLASGASREAGGDELTQVGAGLLGSVAGGLLPGAAAGAGRAVQNFVNDRLPSAGRARDLQFDVRLGNILRQQDIDFGALPEQLQRGMRAEMRDALRSGREVDPAAVRRLLDFQRTGTTPTRGMLSQDPVQITREQNLSRMAANSQDGALQGLPQLHNQNNARLIENLNALGAGRGDPLAAGERVTGAVQGRQAALRATEREAWDAARGMSGYTQPISPAPLSDVVRALDAEGALPFLNPTVSAYMRPFQMGEQPFTPQAYRNLQSMLARDSTAADGNTRFAAGLAARTLRDMEVTPLTQTGSTLPATPAQAAALRGMDAAPPEALAAVNRARAATRAAYAFEDSSPLVRSVLSDGASSDPARIAQRFVIGGTPNEAATLAREVGPEGAGVIRDALANHLKEKALNSSADEVGKFSQSAYNKALKQIGERKLQLFFSPEEIDGLRAVGRAASYMQNQPVGSAVNNSNSGALMLGRGYDAMRALVGKVPFGQSVVLDPLRNIDLSLSQRAAQNVTGGLLAPAQRPPLGSGLVLPGFAAGGLLAAPGAN